MIPNSADVVRTNWPVETNKSLNLYLGTGRCGGCFDSYGLQHQLDGDPSSGRISNTRLAHADVWHRGTHGIDNHVPLTRLVWSELPSEPQNYRQHLHLAEGRLTTSFQGAGFKYTLINSTSPAEADRDLIRFDLSWEGAQRPDLWLEPVRCYTSDYSGDLIAETEIQVDGQQAEIRIKRGNSEGVTLVNATGDLKLTVVADRLCLELSSETGTASITLALGSPIRMAALREAAARFNAMDFDSLKTHTAAAWATRWGSETTAPAGLSEELTALYHRSHYHMLAAYAPDVRCPSPPMGFSGNAWGYHFPQDLSYVHPALLAHGHSDITRAHVEFYHSRITNQIALTQEIYGKPGICWSWEFPIGPDARLFRPEDGGAPNEFQFEIHNAAYPAKMALETAAALHDSAWTREIVWPIVRESARFLTSCLSQESDGHHSIFVTPSMGQDEFGGPDAKNYLCALFASEYMLTKAVALAKELDLENSESAAWQKILTEGFSYDRLLTKYGFYAANESLTFAPRCQKHPVQLNPLWILPLEREPDAPTLAAYAQRRIVCSSEREGQRHPGIPTGFYDGWTLFAFQLSAATLGDAVGHAHELREMHPGRLIDPDYITVYESSGFWKPYYTTSMGLFMQAAQKSAKIKRTS